MRKYAFLHFVSLLHHPPHRLAPQVVAQEFGKLVALVNHVLCVRPDVRNAAFDFEPDRIANRCFIFLATCGQLLPTTLAPAAPSRSSSDMIFLRWGVGLHSSRASSMMQTRSLVAFAQRSIIKCAASSNPNAPRPGPSCAWSSSRAGGRACSWSTSCLRSDEAMSASVCAAESWWLQ